MQRLDRKEFEATVARYLSNWDRALTGEQCDIWWEALQDLHLSDIDRAFRICVQHSRWVPKPADIRKKVTGMESEGGPVQQGIRCSHDGCNNRWTVAKLGQRPVCDAHSSVRQGNWLQQNYSECIGAVRLIDAKGERRAQEVYGPSVVEAVLANPQNDWRASPDTWTEAREPMRAAA